mmetsp:Transcript_46901/g.111290  ORF Transcript_46901/g.111290 Transcript_46901/m.111290 type:complete len:270 (-) Transcript_46901:969-1778(-)
MIFSICSRVLSSLCAPFSCSASARPAPASSSTTTEPLFFLGVFFSMLDPVPFPFPESSNVTSPLRVAPPPRTATSTSSVSSSSSPFFFRAAAHCSINFGIHVMRCSVSAIKAAAAAKKHAPAKLSQSSWAADTVAVEHRLLGKRFELLTEAASQSPLFCASVSAQLRAVSISESSGLIGNATGMLKIESPTRLSEQSFLSPPPLPLLHLASSSVIIPVFAASQSMSRIAPAWSCSIRLEWITAASHFPACIKRAKSVVEPPNTCVFNAG